MVIFNVAAWLAPPEPPVAAVTVMLLVPGGVPELVFLLFPLFPLPHEMIDADKINTENAASARRLRRPGLRRIGITKISPKNGSIMA